MSVPLPLRLKSMLLRLFPLFLVVAAACGRDADRSSAPGAPADRLPPLARDGSVNGAGGVPWGASVDQVLARRGPPVFRSEQPEQVAVLGYPDTLFSLPVQVLFFLHPRHGLFRAGYMTEVSTPAQCAGIFSLVDQGLSSRYPGLQTSESRTGPAVGPPCEGFLEGRGGFMKARTEAASGNRIVMSLVPGNPALMISYTTPQADQWEQRATPGAP